VDGVAVHFDTILPALAGARLTVGAEYAGGAVTNHFDGDVDEVRLFTRAMSGGAAEVNQLAFDVPVYSGAGGAAAAPFHGLVAGAYTRSHFRST
jgi:hypothetical protein